MNPALRELYHDVILEHGRHPRNFGVPESFTHKLEGFNPLCGDKLTLFLEVDNQTITQVFFEGKGCAISMASASLMTEAIKGKKVSEALAFFDAFYQMVMEEPHQPSHVDQTQKWTVLSGVREFPARVKCATLAWHAMRGAIMGDHKLITTEGGRQ